MILIGLLIDAGLFLGAWLMFWSAREAWDFGDGFGNVGFYLLMGAVMTVWGAGFFGYVIYS